VTDAQTQQPVVNATVSLNNQVTVADENGKFSFRRISRGTYELKVSSTGYSDQQQKITVGKNELLLNIRLKSFQLFLQPLEVKATRAGDKAPFAKTNLNKEEIAKNNLGQDLPIILNQTPSIYVSSDAGNGVGYTYMHIRGSDATRINVTLNGIPYNDAEDEGTYFVDLPDFSSSVNSIQIQRGVGTSSNGTGAFGATINLSTNEFNEKPYAEINNSFGSFNTWKNTLKVGSGLIGGHFTVDARVSSITSDGYIDRATSDLKSLAFSAAYINKSSSLRFNIFSGKEKTYQAWAGIDSATLKNDRTYNPEGTEKPGSPYNDQTDNYWQDHYQLFFNHSFSKAWNFNTAVFMTYGRGYYQEYKGVAAEMAAGDYSQTYFSYYGLPDAVVGGVTYDTTDLIRQRWLSNYFYGQILSLQYKGTRDEVTIGGGWTRYDGKHFGNVIWTEYGSANDHQYYNYPALKTNENIYVKWQHQLNTYWNTFADIQYEHVYHRMTGFEGSPTLDITRTFNFVNPKAGISYNKNGWQAFFSYALGQKEPNRDDFQASLSDQPKAEMLHDFELEAEKKNNNYNFGATLYYMLYKDQLVLTGEINDVGAYTRINTPNSYRLGIELQGGYVFAKWLNATANLTLSKNKIKEFTEYIDEYDASGIYWIGQQSKIHHNTDISFSPAVISGITINILPVKNTELSLLGKYVGSQYLDNTQTAGRDLNGFYTQDLRLSYTLKNKLFKEWTLVGQVNNVFNKKYEPNGWTETYISNGSSTTENYYLPMAGTNVLFALNIKL
jgi:iron complex outermembrane receptor protein